MLNLGFSTIGCPGYTIDDIARLSSDTGLTGVELRFVRGTTDLGSLEEFAPANLGETRRRFEDAGAQVVVIDTSVRMNSLDLSVRRENLELARRNTEIAAALGAPYLRVFGGAIPDDQPEADTRRAIVDGLSEVAELSWESGVTALLETHDAYSTARSVRELLDGGASERLGVLWDTLQTYRHGETPAESWSAIGSRVRHVHVKDSRNPTSDAFDFVLIGEGTVPIPEVLSILTDAGFDGFVNFEWEKGWHPEIAEPEVAIPHFARYMTRYLNGALR